MLHILQGQGIYVDTNVGKEKFNQILFGVLNERNQDAYKVEASIFKQLMKLGFNPLNPNVRFLLFDF